MPSLVLALLAACAHAPVPSAPAVSPPAPAAPADTPAPATCTLLTINDTYRIEPLPDGDGGMARVRTLRTRLEAKYGAVALLHAGDFLAPSLMSRTWAGEQMVETLDLLDGAPAAEDPRMFVVFGNHEFDAGKMADAATLDRLIGASQFSWLGTNVVFADGPDGHPLVEDPHLLASARFDCGGLSVGIFGLTTDRKTAEFVTRFDDPVAVARATTATLRKDGADIVVALTHRAKEEDVALLDTLGADGPDLIVGGHEHAHLRAEGADRPVYKADADGASAWRITLRKTAAGIQREEELVSLDESVPEDPAVKAFVDAKIVEHDHLFCSKRSLPDGCLASEVGRTTVPLTAEEIEIRMYETNLGDWIADRARAAFPGAQVAMVNSGSLRLNHDLAAGPIRRQDIEELFAYPSPLVKLTIDGATLEKVLCRATEEWSGNGHWLQISGFAWVHDPVTGLPSRLTNLTTGKRVTAKDRIVAVVPSFLADPSTGRDGYTMLEAPKPAANAPDLKDLVLAGLAAAPAGIAPAVEGRICTTGRPGPCLAAASDAPPIACPR